MHVFKKGVFSGFAHDHHFEATKWRATVEIPERDARSTSVQVVVSADSLRDRQASLSEKDRRKVDAQAAGPEVLDAQHHPTIEFGSQLFEAEPHGDGEHLRGNLRGTLTARGRSVPMDIAIDAERSANEWRVRGEGRVKQSDLGIKPFSGFGGTVGVKDEIKVDLTLVLRPRT